MDKAMAGKEAGVSHIIRVPESGILTRQQHRCSSASLRPRSATKGCRLRWTPQFSPHVCTAEFRGCDLR